jgi:ketol-acid reductoisomerase
MKKILGEVQNGTFARDWILENQANRPHFNRMRDIEATRQTEDAGWKLRAMMSRARDTGRKE